jgi:hypothetical protein
MEGFNLAVPEALEPARNSESVAIQKGYLQDLLFLDPNQSRSRGCKEL